MHPRSVRKTLSSLPGPWQPHQKPSCSPCQTQDANLTLWGDRDVCTSVQDEPLPNASLVLQCTELIKMAHVQARTSLEATRCAVSTTFLPPPLPSCLCCPCRPWGPCCPGGVLLQQSALLVPVLVAIAIEGLLLAGPDLLASFATFT